MPRQKIILIAVFSLSILALVATLCLAGIHPPKDIVTDLNYAPEFFCDVGENHSEFAEGFNE